MFASKQAMLMIFVMISDESKVSLAYASRTLLAKSIILALIKKRSVLIWLSICSLSPPKGTSVDPLIKTFKY